MNTIARARWLLLLGLVALCGCGGESTRGMPAGGQAGSAQAAALEEIPAKDVRQPAVAGLFYERHPDDLGKQVDELLAEAKPETVRNVRGLVCPHAGYRFSGPVAAMGYKELVGKKFETVIVMAPSHYARFDGASIPKARAYETPLGRIAVAPAAADLAGQKPFVLEPVCDVERPQWWSEAPKELPPFGQDTPHTWEHSLEVQLPFLQRTLGDFRLVPIVFGQVDPRQVAKGLVNLVDDKTLLVASSDLSHYHAYETAKGLDATCVKAICAMNVEWIERQEACGRGPIAALVEVARQKHWKARLIDYRNSGDITGDTSAGVVGYAAIAFYEPTGAEAGAPPATPEPQAPAGPRATGGQFSADQREFLLGLARRAVTQAVTSRTLLSVDQDGLDAGLTEPRACFVTLTIDGQLRGCIGSIFPEEPLCRAVASRAAAAAVGDPRFRPVTAKELDQIHIEVSLLTLPEPLEYASPEELLEKLRPGIDGVVLRRGLRQATYLPQVWEQLPDKEEFLGHLAQKAGLAEADWRSKDATVLTYQVEAFEEAAESP